MNTFGVTYHRLPSYIKYVQCENFFEPRHIPVTSKTDVPLTEKIPVREVYHSFVDGHSYSSYDLLKFVRRKGITKPTGPRDEFRLPATTTMDYGWYNDDPDLCGNWFFVRNPAPNIYSDATRFYANLKPFERQYLKL